MVRMMMTMKMIWVKTTYLLQNPRRLRNLKTTVETCRRSRNMELIEDTRDRFLG